MNAKDDNLSGLGTWAEKYLLSSRAFLAELEADPDKALLNLESFLANRDSLIAIMLGTRHRISTPATDSGVQTHLPDFISTLIRETIEVDRRITAYLAIAMKETEMKIAELRKGSRMLSSYRQVQTKFTSVDVQR